MRFSSHYLVSGANLETFARLLAWQPDDLAGAEVSVEWTYLRDLWNHHSRLRDSVVLRAAILDCLQPENRGWLKTCSLIEFNTHFGAVPRPSAGYVQSPSNWSVGRFDATIVSNDAFRRTCRFKWAFNIKPDLVVQTPSGRVLCVEAKWDSAEGSYPASEAEKAIFRRRQLPSVTQTEVQRYLVNHVLGFTGSFAYLARSNFVTAAGRCITWGELLRVLDLSGAPDFVAQWCSQEIGAARPTPRPADPSAS